MKIAIASDHAGFRYKAILSQRLSELGHEVVDFGTDSLESCDYPVFCHAAASAVQSGECDRGIVLGGSGNGEAMVANRHSGIRCALCWNENSARFSRLHNNANMISIGERMISPELALKIVEIWLSTEYEGGRHDQRIAQIEDSGAI